MRSGAEIEEAMKALEAFEDANPGYFTEFILHTDGEGAIIIKDRMGKVADAVDFTEIPPLMKIVKMITERVLQSA